MSNLALSLVTGVVSGVVVAFLVFVLRTIWIRIVLPWYEEMLYRGAKIEGIWLAEVPFPSGEVNKHRMTLKRTGHRVSGRTVCTKGRSEGQSYDLKGTFNNTILTMTYQIDDPRRIERGSTAMMLVNDGKELSGCVIYYDDQTHSLMSADCRWKAVLSTDDDQSCGQSSEDQ